MIKRSSAFMAILISLLLFSACSTQATIEYSLEEFETTIITTVNDEEITANLIYNSPTDITLTFIQPENLADLKVQLVEGEKVISLGEVTINLTDVQNLTNSDNVISALYEALGNFGSSTHIINQTGKTNCSGETIYGSYTFTVDADKNSITSLSVSDYLYLFED